MNALRKEIGNRIERVVDMWSKDVADDSDRNESGRRECAGPPRKPVVVNSGGKSGAPSAAEGTSEMIAPGSFDASGPGAPSLPLRPPRPASESSLF